MSIIRDTIDCGTWRERRPSAHKLWIKNRPSIDGESINGGLGRALGLLGGAFMGTLLAQQGSSRQYTASDYVQSGILMLTDGVENEELGRPQNSAATKWNNIAGTFTNGWDVTSNGSWKDSGLQFDGLAATRQRFGANIGLTRTIETCFTMYSGRIVLYGINSTATSGTKNLVSIITNTTLFDGWTIFNIPNNIGFDAQRTGFHTFTVSFFEDTLLSAHLDGSPIVASGSSGSSWQGKVDNTTIGGRDIDTTYDGHGIVHCVRYYDHELTDDEVAANYAIDQARFGLA